MLLAERIGKWVKSGGMHLNSSHQKLTEDAIICLVICICADLGACRIGHKTEQKMGFGIEKLHKPHKILDFMFCYAVFVDSLAHFRSLNCQNPAGS
ncbi:hypothetical protein SAMN05421690_105310 [Nitrosomonas sp. Nm51]|nr:hypothetical protein SAMN05421690_105310 [Nitrosomonas sp. Nm51]